MLLRTFNKIEQLFLAGNGYQRTSTLLQNGVTTLQIRQLIENGNVERVSHGIYWWKNDTLMKPKFSKYLELQMANSKAVICTDSALYLLGLLRTEPEVVSIATSRLDRSRMNMNFPVHRHYFSDQSIQKFIREIEIPGGTIKVYSLDRSVIDCIRLRNEMDPALFEQIIVKYNRSKEKNEADYLAYADIMGMHQIARKFLEKK